MRTDFVKASYCMNRILYAKSRIAYANKVRGIGPGTFWMDEKKVDEYIKEWQDWIEALEKRIAEINKSK